MEESNENRQDRPEESNNQGQRVNQSRSPFTKLDNKRKNLHSLDSGRDEIADDDMMLDADEMEQDEHHNKGMQERDQARKDQ